MLTLFIRGQNSHLKQRKNFPCYSSFSTNRLLNSPILLKICINWFESSPGHKNKSGETEQRAVSPLFLRVGEIKIIPPGTFRLDPLHLRHNIVMKKSLPIVVAIVAGAMILISCKKEHTCTCVTKISYTTTDSTVTTIKDTRSKAFKECSSKSVSTDTSTKLCYPW